MRTKCFRHLDLIWIDIGLSNIDCFVETRNYSIISLAFIANSFRVIEENLVFETVQSGPYFFLNVFSALKGAHFYILFVIVSISVLFFFQITGALLTYFFLLYTTV